jgi:hypothetical protein
VCDGVTIHPVGGGHHKKPDLPSTPVRLPPECLKPLRAPENRLRGRGIAALHSSQETVMNLNLTALPLPSLYDGAATRHRRHHIAGWDLHNGALRRFQQAAESLQSEYPIPSVDSIASAARELMRQCAGTRQAPGIVVRRRCLRALHAMSNEPTWGLAAEHCERVASIAAYSAERERLIPAAMPVIGGLDDALLVELAWPSLRFELDDYLSFRRLRIEEAARRGRHAHEIGYDRGQWLQARFAELAALARARAHANEAYAVAAAPCLFRIH